MTTASAPQMSLPQACQVFKMLADEPRLRLLLLLAGRAEMNVTALCQAAGQTQPAVSHHLALLRMSGLVVCRREGKNNFYSLNAGPAPDLLRLIKF